MLNTDGAGGWGVVPGGCVKAFNVNLSHAHSERPLVHTNIPTIRFTDECAQRHRETHPHPYVHLRPSFRHDNGAYQVVQWYTIEKNGMEMNDIFCAAVIG